ncbi:MAG TPA: hypothetical protein VLM39_08010, partial [Ignavibacteriaceae bacterium]|nr:hypothetical protein [Ignavibacteriaceae bacterium]
LGVDGQVDEAVAREQVEHVIEEADTGADVGLAGAVEVEGELDFGFFGLAGELGCSGGHRSKEKGKRKKEKVIQNISRI